MVRRAVVAKPVTCAHQTYLDAPSCLPQCEAAREAYVSLREQRRRPYVTIKYVTALSGVCKGRVKRVQGSNDRASDKSSERGDDERPRTTAKRRSLVREMSFKNEVTVTATHEKCPSAHSTSAFAQPTGKHLKCSYPLPSFERRRLLHQQARGRSSLGVYHDEQSASEYRGPITGARKASVHALGAFQRGAVDPMSKGVVSSQHRGPM